MTAGIKKELIERATQVRSLKDGRAPARLLLTEGDDERVRRAAEKITTLGVARVTLLSDSYQAVQPFESIKALPLSQNNFSTSFAEELFKLRQAKGLTKADAEKVVQSALGFGAMYLRSGEADAVVSGSIHTTADVFRTGVQIVRVKPGINTASSFFLMILADGRAVTFADCGVIPYPNKEQLCDIAISAAENHQKLTKLEPKVALLSFSTKGSAEHERVDFVKEVLSLIKTKAPQLAVDGELQFDAAFVPEVAKRKAPGSLVAGQANVFIFPNLDAGNIAYKIAERIGGATALGPIIQGLSKPWMDLSRGCSADDIVLVAAIAILMGEPS